MTFGKALFTVGFYSEWPELPQSPSRPACQRPNMLDARVLVASGTFVFGQLGFDDNLRIDLARITKSGASVALLGKPAKGKTLSVCPFTGRE